jgi:hypothetical protein
LLLLLLRMLWLDEEEEEEGVLAGVDPGVFCPSRFFRRGRYL